MSLRSCSRSVFTAFRRAERCADRATGAAGPVFVTIGAVLLSLCVFTFFEIVFPRAFVRPDSSPLTAPLAFLVCGWLVYSFSFHYFMAISISPGTPSDPIGFRPPTPSPRVALYRLLRLGQGHIDLRPTRLAAADVVNETSREARRANGQARVCKKCPAAAGALPVKPERTHHSLLDCPWINGCVGLHNERYFVLFMIYLAVSCGVVVLLGWPPLLDMLDFYKEWPYRSPRVLVLLLYILAAAIGFALTVMAAWQLWLIAKGETTVEASDNDYYRHLAKVQGKRFINPYDFGRAENLREFFNVVTAHRPYYTLLLPLPYPPAADGWHWRRRRDADFDLDEDLSSEEDEGDR